MRNSRVACVLALALAACGPGEQPVTLTFAAVAQGKPISCAGGPDGMTLIDLRLYVSDVALLTADGRAVPVKLDTAPPWQSADVALIDLEDGSGTCDSGSPPMNAGLSGRAPAGTYTGVQFVVGVPFARNHADPALAPTPLDQTAMHWHWQAGYKFIRAGLSRNDEQTWLHLGSTGCAGRIGDVTTCAQSNRLTVKLPKFNAASEKIAIDVAAMLGEVAADGDSHACQSEPDNQNCPSIFRHLGLTEAPQDVFHVMAR